MKKSWSRKPPSESVQGPLPRAIAATQYMMEAIYKLTCLAAELVLLEALVKRAYKASSLLLLKKANSCKNGRFCSCLLKYDDGCFGYEDIP